MMISFGVTKDPLEILFQLLFNRYLHESYCLTVVSENDFNTNMITNSMTYIKITSPEKLVQEMLYASEMGCSDYIIQMSDPQQFMLAYEKVNILGNLRRSDRKLIFLPVSTENDISLLNILTLSETSFVANVLLIIPIDNTQSCQSFDIVTHNFEGPNEEVSDPLYLDKWYSCNESFETNANLFPHDISNLFGKTVTVSCFNYEPYVILDLPQERLGRIGTEMNIMDEFCRWVNCSVEIVSDDGYEWGVIYENRTGNGVLGKIVEDEADFGITALYSWYDSYQYMDFSVSCIRSGVTAIAPSPRLLASWELPLMPFSWVMWITVFVTFIYASFALFLAQQWSSDKVLLKTFGIMVTQSQKDLGNDWRVRSITGWLLITGLVLDNAYGGGLAATFTVPKYEKSVDTVQDIVDRGMQWGATHDAWTFSLMSSEDPKIMQLVKQFQALDATKLKQKSFTRSMAFSIEKLPAGYFAIGDYITKEAVLDMELMLEDFYFEQTVVMARKSSPYIGKVSELIGRLHETGLILAWETQVALKYMDYNTQLEVKLSRLKKEADIVPLGFRHVAGIFIVYALGVSFSFILLSIEIFIRSRKIKKAILANIK